RFFLQRPDEETVPVLWPVPLSLNMAHDAAVFDKAADDLPAAKADIIQLNTGQSGFYRVAYDTELTARLAAAVAANKLIALDRLGLLRDSFEAAKAGFGDTESALALLASYRHETNAATWSAIVGAIADVRRVMGDEELREAMKPFTRKLSARELARLGWEE